MSSTAARRAVIIGCGIAGPVVAMFLKRAGIEPVLYEAAPVPSDCEGSFLMVTSNGLGVLRTLGVIDDLAPDSVPCTGMTLRSSRGRRLGQVRHDQGTGSVGSLLMSRGLLHRVLREEALRRGVAVEFGKRLADVEVTENNAVTARFTDGTLAHGDFLVGADGVNSVTRRIIDPDGAPAAYTGRVSAGGFLQAPHIAATPNSLHLTLGRRAFFGHLVRPSGEVYWFSDMAFPGQPTRRDLESISREEWKQRLLDLHGNDPGPIPDIVRTLRGEFGVYPLCDLPPLSTWHSGPVVLVGDAAHATSPYGGQGASMAMESAMVLAKCVRDIPETERAFAAYQSLRKDRAERLVRLARRIGRHSRPIGPIAMNVRDLVTPIVLRTAANPRSRSWVYSYTVDWDEKVA